MAPEIVPAPSAHFEPDPYERLCARLIGLRALATTGSAALDSHSPPSNKVLQELVYSLGIAAADALHDLQLIHERGHMVRPVSDPQRAQA